ncbi:MAG: hypothetical protein HOM18_14605 [Candidatus Marinimicrobia bacterium]|jgi:hypothetical protein|nr:hypothetical protein [Candidatus Neomarinimicrobiota bacterium]
MKKNTMIKLASSAAAVLLATTSANAGYTMKKKVGDADTKLTFFGFSQINAEVETQGTDNNLKMGADRIRLGWKYISGPVRGKVFLDFNQDDNDENEEVGANRVIKDAFIAYKFSDAAVVKAGVIKTPVGMGFTIPGWNLDVVKRAFDKQLAFERGNGIMISGRDMGMGNDAKVNGLEMGHERPMQGFGYDVMIANQTTRSGAVVETTTGATGDNAYMARVHYDRGEALHLEVSAGISPNAAADATVDKEDYKVLNIGLDSHFGEGKNVKAEYYDVSGVKGAKNDVKTLALTYTQYITPNLELAIKTISGESTKVGTTDKSGRNTYAGFNYYPNKVSKGMNRGSKRKNNQHVIKVNYLATSGSLDSPKFKTNDAVLAMYQFKF